MPNLLVRKVQWSFLPTQGKLRFGQNFNSIDGHILSKSTVYIDVFVHRLELFRFFKIKNTFPYLVQSVIGVCQIKIEARHSAGHFLKSLCKASQLFHTAQYYKQNWHFRKWFLFPEPMPLSNREMILKTTKAFS